VPRETKLRVAILSDTHGVLDGRVAEVVRGCDLAVHGGDVGSAEVIDQLQPRQGVVVAVYGNNDTEAKWAAAERARLWELPKEAEHELPGGVLAVIHGHQHARAATRHRWLRRRFPGARAIVYGHSHHLVCDKSEQPWVLNPGAAGRSRTYGGPSCLVLTASEHRWTIRTHRFSR
jgi:hypothetical protein